jgi:hypothetical protein
MATPVVPNQFAVGKNKIIHKPTTATFSFETGQTTFKSIDWGHADKQRSSGLDYRCAAVAEQAAEINESKRLLDRGSIQNAARVP